MLWEIRRGDTDSDYAGEVEAETQEEAMEKALDLREPGWRDYPDDHQLWTDNCEYLYVRRKRVTTPYEQLSREMVEKTVKNIIRLAKSDDEIRSEIRLQLNYLDAAGIAITTTTSGPMRMSMVMMWSPDGKSMVV